MGRLPKCESNALTGSLLNLCILMIKLTINLCAYNKRNEWEYQFDHQREY